MADIKLLDCTLRDGGYVNNWQWGFGSALSLFMMALIVLSIGLLNRIDRTPAKEGSAKW